MTKKDYELIAGAFHRSAFIPDKNKVRQGARMAMHRLIVVDLAATLKHENPKFDVHKFYRACGYWN